MSATATAPSSATAIRPFSVGVSEEQLNDLRRRVTATRWPERETVADGSQGVQLAAIQKLARYWGTDYDWVGPRAHGPGVGNPDAATRP